MIVATAGLLGDPLPPTMAVGPPPQRPTGAAPAVSFAVQARLNCLTVVWLTCASGLNRLPV